MTNEEKCKHSLEINRVLQRTDTKTLRPKFLKMLLENLGAFLEKFQGNLRSEFGRNLNRKFEEILKKLRKKSCLKGKKHPY